MTDRQKPLTESNAEIVGLQQTFETFFEIKHPQGGKIQNVIFEGAPFSLEKIFHRIDFLSHSHWNHIPEDNVQCPQDNHVFEIRLL